MGFLLVPGRGRTWAGIVLLSCTLAMNEGSLGGGGIGRAVDFKSKRKSVLHKNGF